MMRTPLVAFLALYSLSASALASLHGRFITISDLHLDQHYVAGSSVSKACHTGNPSSETNRAGAFGTPVSDCDAPESLIQATMQELERKWKGKVDFVVAMGDFARHDLDSDIPRTVNEIVQLNANLTSRLADIFDDVPLVPSIGNNDVWPHNIMRSGPSSMISSIENVWKDFIPEEQFHTFARGGYYAKEVIPGELVVVAMNTILWFDNNKVVDGCPPPSKNRKIDAGTEELRWLAAQLKQWRELGMQVILSGHVPPTDYYRGCRDRFQEVMLAFQDTIVATVFGHKNVDTFSYFRQTKPSVQTEDDEAELASGPISALAMADDLHSSYLALPKRPNEDDYVFWNIAPSVIPTYLPGYRVWTYNTTRDTKYIPKSAQLVIGQQELDPEALEDDSLENATDHYESLAALTQHPLSLKDTLVHLTFDTEAARKKRKGKKHKKKKGKKPKYPSLPRHISPESPSRQNRYLTPLGYVQYYMDLEKWNAKGAGAQPEYDVEYISGHAEQLDVQKKEGTASYGLSDLTVGSWLRLAKQVTSSKKAWAEYQKRMYVSSQ